MKASAITAPDTVLRYSAARPLLSAMVAERAVCSVKCSVVSAWSSCCWCSASGRARLEAERAADADALASGAPGRLGAVMTSPQVAVGCVELGRAGEDDI